MQCVHCCWQTNMPQHTHLIQAAGLCCFFVQGFLLAVRGIAGLWCRPVSNGNEWELIRSSFNDVYMIVKTVVFNKPSKTGCSGETSLVLHVPSSSWAGKRNACYYLLTLPSTVVRMIRMLMPMGKMWETELYTHYTLLSQNKTNWHSGWGHYQYNIIWHSDMWKPW